MIAINNVVIIVSLHCSDIFSPLQPPPVSYNLHRPCSESDHIQSTAFSFLLSEDMCTP